VGIADLNSRWAGTPQGSALLTRLISTDRGGRAPAVGDDLDLLEGDEPFADHGVEFLQDGPQAILLVDDLDQDRQVARERQDPGRTEMLLGAETLDAPEHRSAGQTTFAEKLDDRLVQRPPVPSVRLADVDAGPRCWRGAARMAPVSTQEGDIRQLTASAKEDDRKRRILETALDVAWPIISIAAGSALVLLALRDIFFTLWRPTGLSRVSWTVARRGWGAFAWLDDHSPGLLTLAGPWIVLMTAAAWGLLLTLGWALIYWPLMPGHFLYGPGLIPELNGGLTEAIYFSLVTLGTLGNGDLAPMSPELRLLAPLEAILGFLLFTAVISWIVSLYPATARQQSLARDVMTIADAAPDLTERVREGAISDTFLASLAARVVVIRGDLVQFPVTYFFRPPDPRSALPLALPFLLRLSTEACDAPSSATSLQGDALGRAVHDFVELIAEEYLDGSEDSVDECVIAYWRDHRWLRDHG
jgi:hypothetical protein